MRLAICLVCLAACVDTSAEPTPGQPPKPPLCTIKELPPVTVSVGANPTGLIGASYVNGYDTSLIVANTGSSSIHILRPTGTLEFSVAELATGASPVAVETVDTTGDAKQDIVVANQDDDTVSLFRNRGWDREYGGVATFDPPITIPVGRKPSAIVKIYHQLGDDIAVANRGDNTITILVNDGHGSYSVGSTIAVGGEPVALATAYLDSDYEQDLIVANYADDTIGLLLNDGTAFQPMVTHATGKGPTSIATRSASKFKPAAIWIANAGSNDVSFFEHQGGARLAPGVLTSTIGSPRAVALDIKYDLVRIVDHDHGVIRTLGSPDAIAVGAHPNSLVVESAIDFDFAVANADKNTVTIRGHECILKP